MRLFTFVGSLGLRVLILAVISLGCTHSDSGTPPPVQDPSPCRSAGPSLPDSGGTELLLAGVSRAQANDLRCGPPEDRTRICRALFLVATLDPALHLNDEPLRQQIGDALTWALHDAGLVAPPHLIDAFQTLLETTRTLTTSADDRSLSDAIARRAEPATTTAIDEHWRTNCV